MLMPKHSVYQQWQFSPLWAHSVRNVAEAWLYINVYAHGKSLSMRYRVYLKSGNKVINWKWLQCFNQKDCSIIEYWKVLSSSILSSAATEWGAVLWSWSGAVSLPKFLHSFSSRDRRDRHIVKLICILLAMVTVCTLLQHMANARKCD